MASEYGQDQWVLKQLGGKRSGFFLDSGAAHPVDASNTEQLEFIHGWRGICVEGGAGYYNLLRRVRKNSQCFHAVLSDKVENVRFAEHAVPTISGIVDRYTDETRARLGFTLESGNIVKTSTMADIIAKAVDVPRVIDYWSLDVEGGEYHALLGFPWDTHVLRVLTVEHNKEEPKRSDIRAFLEAKGYVHVTLPLAEFEDGYVLSRPVA